MMLKCGASGSRPAVWWHGWRRVGSAAALAAATAMILAAGCLDRPVVEQKPATSNFYVDEIRQTAVDKIDLLFMIDNSRSMADKQEILADAVPVLVERLVTPVCLDNKNQHTGNATREGACPNGGQPEFSPIRDIHIAVVSSSLGARGGDECLSGATENDKAWPIGKVRGGLKSWDETGFLAWDPDAVDPAHARNQPVPGVTEAEELNAQFKNMVTATGEVGCGFEASLEAWYRFLIDPEPSSDVTREGSNPTEFVTVANFNPLDTTILELRQRFLRPDSLVAVVMLTDENDCSIRDDGLSWMVGRRNGSHPPRATSICDTNPNDKCCRSCLHDPTAECPPDPVCDELGPYLDNEKGDDQVNLRCYNQKARFGIDFLQPIERYVRGLTEPILRRDPRAITASEDPSEVIQNPLFAGGKRDPSLVFLAGIVGVPWQDVSTEESWAKDKPLTYLTYEQLEKAGRLDWILPPEGSRFPLDPLMYETPKDRTTLAGKGLAQTHPGIGAPLVPSCTKGSGENAPWTCSQGTNPINGRESPISGKDDLQYACVFDIPAEECTECDCTTDEERATSPLCQGARQIKAKAYPGVRELEVLRGFGDKTNNAIIASICPKISDKARIKDPSYGYTPAVSAIIERLKVILRGKCLPRPLSACNCDLAVRACDQPGDIPCSGSTVPGQVSCAVVEARKRDLANPVCPPCEGFEGREEATAEIDQPVENTLKNMRHCGNAGQPSCKEAYCLCAIKQLEGPALETCQTQVTPPSDLYGYCYIDPALYDESNPVDAAKRTAALQIVERCPSTQRRQLRFAGDGVPAKDAVAVIACLGANIQD